MEWNEVVNGIPLIFVVMGLVELAKVFGASGKLLTGISVGMGLRWVCCTKSVWACRLTLPAGLARLCMDWL